MRHSVTTALLAVCALLLAANLLLMVLDPGPVPVAFSQAAGGKVIMTASNTQNEAFCFLYDTEAKKLVSYMTRGGGLQLRAIRNCSFDFNRMIDEYPDSNEPTSVKKMKDLIEKLGRGKKR